MFSDCAIRSDLKYETARFHGVIFVDSLRNFKITIAKMSLMAKVYNAAFKRTSTYFLLLVAGAFLFERTFDMNTQKIFKYINRGVSLFIQSLQPVITVTGLLFHNRFEKI